MFVHSVVIIVVLVAVLGAAASVAGSTCASSAACAGWATARALLPRALLPPSWPARRSRRWPRGSPGETDGRFPSRDAHPGIPHGLVSNYVSSACHASASARGVHRAPFAFRHPEEIGIISNI